MDPCEMFGHGRLDGEVCVCVNVPVCVAGGELDLKCKEFVFAVDNGSLTGFRQEAT